MPNHSERLTPGCTLERITQLTEGRYWRCNSTESLARSMLTANIGSRWGGFVISIHLSSGLGRGTRGHTALSSKIITSWPMPARLDVLFPGNHLEDRQLAPWTARSDHWTALASCRRCRYRLGRARGRGSPTRCVAPTTKNQPTNGKTGPRFATGQSRTGTASKVAVNWAAKSVLKAPGQGWTDGLRRADLPGTPMNRK